MEAGANLEIEAGIGSPLVAYRDHTKSKWEFNPWSSMRWEM